MNITIYHTVILSNFLPKFLSKLYQDVLLPKNQKSLVLLGSSEKCEYFNRILWTTIDFLPHIYSLWDDDLKRYAYIYLSETYDGEHFISNFSDIEFDHVIVTNNVIFDTSVNKNIKNIIYLANKDEDSSQNINIYDYLSENEYKSMNENKGLASKDINNKDIDNQVQNIFDYHNHNNVNIVVWKKEKSGWSKSITTNN